MIKPNIRLLLLSLIIGITSCMIQAQDVSASGFALSTSPPLLQIEALPPSDVRAPFTIRNDSDSPVDLKVLLLPFRASEQENGQIEYIRESTPTIFEKIQVIDEDTAVDQVSLGPKQEKKLMLRAVVGNKEQSADYYFSIIFLTIPKNGADKSKADEKNNVSNAQAGIATNVILSVGARENAKGLIDDFTAPWYVESGPVPFNIRIKNTDTHYISPKGSIYITNMFGQTIGKVELPPTHVLVGTTRSLMDIQQAAKKSAIAQSPQSKKDTPKALWPEKFLVGFYTAKLTIDMSDKGPSYSKSLIFFAFPIKLLLGIAISIITIIIVYLRVKRRLQTE